MLTIPNRKNKIDLSLYNYKKDLETRSLLSQFSHFDIQVLEEVVFNSVRIPIPQILRKLETLRDELSHSLQKLEQSGLISIENDCILVDKEMRKYFEVHITKFQEGFEPNLDFVQNLLRLIPISILPLWYPLPRSADSIFQYLTEKIFASTKTYERYLNELNFEEPFLNQIILDLFDSPDFVLDAEKIKSKYQLSEEAYMESLLQLEYHFVCYASYIPEGNGWKEVLTPFSEWHKFLLFKKKTFPKSLNGNIEILDKKNIEKRYKSLFSQTFPFEKHLREIEKSLKNLISLDWILLEDFYNHSIMCFNETSHLILKRQGRVLQYAIPKYTQEERDLVLSVILNRFYKEGFLEIGLFQEKECFRFTPSGKAYLISQ